MRIRLSPDGKRVAAQIRTSNTSSGPGLRPRQLVGARHVQPDRQRWPTLDAGRTLPHLRLAAGSAGDVEPVPASVERRGAEERLTKSDRPQRTNAITIDGSPVIFEQQTAQRDYDLMMFRLADPAMIEPLLQTPFDEKDAEMSPDGRWMAYDSNESGQLQVYVRPFPNVAAAQYQVSTDGGRSPTWSPRGGELFFVSGTSMMRVAVDTTEGVFKSGNPTRLFDAPNLALDGRFASGGTPRTYDIAPDGSDSSPSS